jgi:hypothetical protein
VKARIFKLPLASLSPEEFAGAIIVSEEEGVGVENVVRVLKWYWGITVEWLVNGIYES